MNMYLKSGFAAALLGLGIFASAGSAYAAGCLTPDQGNISLTEHNDTSTDEERAADINGYRCDVAPVSQQTQVQAQVQQKPATNTKTTGAYATN